MTEKDGEIVSLRQELGKVDLNSNPKPNWQELGKVDLAQKGGHLTGTLTLTLIP